MRCPSRPHPRTGRVVNSGRVCVCVWLGRAFVRAQFVREGWDFVGAPWRGVQGGPSVGNGGFSLRRRAAMLAVCREWPDPSGINEDVYFGHILLYSRFWVASVEVGWGYWGGGGLLGRPVLFRHRGSRLRCRRADALRRRPVSA